MVATIAPAMKYVEPTKNTKDTKPMCSLRSLWQIITTYHCRFYKRRVVVAFILSCLLFLGKIVCVRRSPLSRHLFAHCHPRRGYVAYVVPLRGSRRLPPSHKATVDESEGMTDVATRPWRTPRLACRRSQATLHPGVWKRSNQPISVNGFTAFIPQ